MSITNITNPEILNGSITLNYEVACSLASTFSTELPQHCFRSVWLASSVLQCLPAGLGKLSGEPWGSRGLLSGKGEEVYDTNLMLLFMSSFFCFYKTSNINYLSVFRKTISIGMNVTVRTSLGLILYGGSSQTARSFRYQKPSLSLKYLQHTGMRLKRDLGCVLCVSGVPKEAGTQTCSWLIPAETSPAPYKVSTSIKGASFSWIQIWI